MNPYETPSSPPITSRDLTRPSALLLAFSASTIFLTWILVSAMRFHSGGSFDGELFRFSENRIVLISIVAALPVYFLRTSKWYWACFLGATAGFLIAICYVNPVT